MRGASVSAYGLLHNVHNQVDLSRFFRWQVGLFCAPLSARLTKVVVSVRVRAMDASSGAVGMLDPIVVEAECARVG